MKLKKLKKWRLNSLILFLFFLSYFLFFLSLERCTEGEDNCCQKFEWMKLKVIEESLSCILIIILFELIILNKISKIHIFHFIFAFGLFYSYSNGVDFDDHGYYNIKYFFIIVISILILISFLRYLLLFKKKKIIFLYLETLLIFLYLFQNILNNYIICNDWAKGLNNTSIDNDKNKYNCQIQIPKSCPYKFGKFFLDRNKFSPIDCSKGETGSRKKILKYSKSRYINENNCTLHIGFTLTNKEEKFFKDMNYSSFRNYIYENFIDMNNKTLVNLFQDKKPEISVDFSNNKNGKMNVNLNFNKTLSDERKKLEGLTTPYSKNIMVLYLDSVSRAYSIRQLKKTLRFFEKFIKFNGNKNSKFPNENYHSFQFFKYHSHKFYTTGNYPILFYGNHRNETNKYITLYLKKNGYITSYSADTCYNDFIRSLHNFSFADIYDHQYIVCDPNYLGAGIKLTCLYGKLHVEYMFEYINQFWRKYKDNRKFSLLLTNFAHEGSLEKLKYIDNIIYEFFNKLFEDNLFKDTSIFLLSDHGVGIPSIYYLNDFFKYEKVLPMFYLLINDRKNVSYESQYKYLYQNQQTFITGFDIYNTIINLIYGDNYGTKETSDSISIKGKSLFNEINQMIRHPENYSQMDTYSCI